MGADDVRLAMVVTAAGRGVRFESERPKQYAPVQGVPMLRRTVAALHQCASVHALVVVVNAEDVEFCTTEIVSGIGDKLIGVVPGGQERALSVRNGLRALSAAGTWDLVGVHDGARPLVTCAEMDRAVEVLLSEPEVDGVVVATPSADTLKAVDQDGFITGTPNRGSLWRAQTPQLFRWDTLQGAYGQDDDVLLTATDDSALVEIMGGKVKVVQGAPENLKITTRVDLRFAECVLAERER